MFILSAGHGIQASAAAFRFADLDSLPLAVPPWYFVLSGALWCAGWLAGGIGLWGMREGARRFLLAWIPFSLAGWAADRLWLARSPELWQSIAFAFGVRLLAGAALALLLIAFSGRFRSRAG